MAFVNNLSLFKGQNYYKNKRKKWWLLYPNFRCSKMVENRSWCRSGTITLSVSNDEFNDRCNQIHAVKQVTPYQRIRKKNNQVVVVVVEQACQT